MCINAFKTAKLLGIELPVTLLGAGRRIDRIAMLFGAVSEAGVDDSGHKLGVLEAPQWRCSLVSYCTRTRLTAQDIARASIDPAKAGRPTVSHAMMYSNGKRL